MTKRPRDSAVGPWAKVKLDALPQYLDYYTTVLKNQGHSGSVAQYSSMRSPVQASRA